MTAQAVPERWWLLRPGQPSDHNLVLDSWIRGNRSVVLGASPQDDKSYTRFQDWLIKRLLKTCALTVACHPNETDYVLGYAVTSTNAVHYVWVRDKFRFKGIASHLVAPYLNQQGVVYTHRLSDQCRKDAWAKGIKQYLDVPSGWVYDRFHAYNLAVTGLAP